MDFLYTIILLSSLFNGALAINCIYDIRNIGVRYGPSAITCRYPQDSCVMSKYTICQYGICITTTADGCMKRGSDCKTSTCNLFKETMKQIPALYGAIMTKCEATCCQSNYCNKRATLLSDNQIIPSNTSVTSSKLFGSLLRL